MRKLALATLLLLMLTGCFGEACTNYPPPVNMSPTDVVGSWQDRTRGAVLRFAADGTFEGTDLAAFFEDFREMLPADFDALRDRLDGSGTWELDSPIGDKSGTLSNINLGIYKVSVGPLRGPGAMPGALGTYVHAEMRDSTVVLTGPGHIYVKCAGECRPMPAESTPATRPS